MDNEKSLPQIMYEAYCEQTGWRSAVTGAALPQWNQCSKAVQRAWDASSNAALDWMIEHRVNVEKESR